MLTSLNGNQKTAVLTTEGPVLILAGAGSGKTKTIIARNVHLIQTGVSPKNILTVTFTNKAAREMKSRGQKLINSEMPEFTTFHSWGVKFMKSMSDIVLYNFKLNKSMTIVDESEQVAILNKIKSSIFNKEVAKAFKPSTFLLTLGNIQNNCVSYENIDKTSTELENINLDLSMFDEAVSIEQIAELFVKYKSELRQNNCVDFDDLINIPILILSQYPDIKRYIHTKYQYIMVDEFQDTNRAQLELLKSILNSKNNICVVGDDSQSIYGWRGANIEYILNFHKIFPGCKSLNLSINYRSSKEIVGNANHLLTHANEVHEFKLALESFSQKKGIVSSQFFETAADEAKNVTREIRVLIGSKIEKYGDIAILFRTSFIIRSMELELISNHIPYKIHKGRTLLERKIVKTFINYLKVIQNNTNSIALTNFLINSDILTEKRAFDFLNASEEEGDTLLNYLKSGNFKKQSRLQNSTIEKIDGFIREIAWFNEQKDFKVMYAELCKRNLLQRENYKITITQSSHSEKKVLEAHSNLDLLAMVYKLGQRYNSLDTLLETISIEGEEDDCDENKVNLMTVHASKGLEFEGVFIIGASQDVFPSARSQSFKEMEEERRLFYVAITRAKHYLKVSGAKSYYAGQSLRISPFVKEAQILSSNL